MLKHVGVLGAVLAAFLVAAPNVAEATTISAPFVTVGVGDTFTIPMSIADAVDLTSWQFDLSFKPSVVHANSVSERPFKSRLIATAAEEPRSRLEELS
jgi:hypothetical protein